MGRMAEPEEIVRGDRGRRRPGPLAGRTVLVTAGPTHEPVDPVRFLGNRSSGKMGFALAAEAARRGARTVLVAGPVALPTPPGVTRIDVVTAREMERGRPASTPRRADLIVMAAAVADFRPRPIAAAARSRRNRGLPRPSSWRRTRTSWRACGPWRRGRCWWASPPRPTTSTATPVPSWSARGRISWSPTTSPAADIAFESEANEVTVFRREGEPVFLSRRPKAELAASLFDLFAAMLPPS